MARPQAADYNLKRSAIVASAARLFARDGYDRTSMSALALECGVSKALLYHYYENKDALLFDVIGQHLNALLEAVEAANKPTAKPVDQLGLLIRALLDAYQDADDLHKVQIEELAKLPAPMQDELKAIERRLVQVFASALQRIDPLLERDKALLKPATMSLFGMLNWSYMWFRPSGALSRADYADMVTHIIVDGVRGLSRAKRKESARTV